MWFYYKKTVKTRNEYLHISFIGPNVLKLYCQLHDARKRLSFKVPIVNIIEYPTMSANCFHIISNNKS